MSVNRNSWSVGSKLGMTGYEHRPQPLDLLGCSCIAHCKQQLTKC